MLTIFNVLHIIYIGLLCIKPIDAKERMNFYFMKWLNAIHWHINGRSVLSYWLRLCMCIKICAPFPRILSIRPISPRRLFLSLYLSSLAIHLHSFSYSTISLYVTSIELHFIWARNISEFCFDRSCNIAEKCYIYAQQYVFVFFTLELKCVRMCVCVCVYRQTFRFWIRIIW